MKTWNITAVYQALQAENAADDYAVLPWLMARSKTRPPPEVEAALLRASAKHEGFFEALLRALHVHCLVVFERDFKVWLYGFVTERLPASAWCRISALKELFLFCGDSFKMPHNYLRHAFWSAPDLRNSRTLLEVALVDFQHLHVVDCFSAELLLQSRDLLELACRGWRDWPDYEARGFLELLPPELARDRDLALLVAASVRDFGASFRALSPELREDREVALEFLQSGGGRLRDAPAALRVDKDAVCLAVARDGLQLWDADEALRSDPVLLRLAARSAGAAFFRGEGHAHGDSRELAEEALASDAAPHAVFPLLSARLRSDANLALKALAVEGAADGLFGEACWAALAEGLKVDAGFVERLLRLRGAWLRFLPDEQRGDRRLVTLAAENEPEALWHAAPQVWRCDEGLRVFSTDVLFLCGWEALPDGARRQLGLERFQCPVCYGLPARVGIRQCKEGHLLCGACAARLPTPAACPQCRCGMEGRPRGARCLFAEQELQERLEELRAERSPPESAKRQKSL
jgi:hypothetical protein